MVGSDAHNAIEREGEMRVQWTTVNRLHPSNVSGSLEIVTPIVHNQSRQWNNREQHPEIGHLRNTYCKKHSTADFNKIELKKGTNSNSSISPMSLEKRLEILPDELCRRNEAGS